MIKTGIGELGNPFYVGLRYSSDRDKYGTFFDQLENEGFYCTLERIVIPKQNQTKGLRDLMNRNSVLDSIFARQF